MKSVRGGWWWCLLLCVGAVDAQEVGDSPFLGGFLRESRVVYPLQLGAWEARGEHLYEQPELGASVRFQQAAHEDRWIDVYFYPAGLSTPERLDQDVAATLEGIRQHGVGAGGFERLEFGPVRSFDIDVKDGEAQRPIAARSATLRFEKDGKRYHSALVMLVKDLYYFKGRFSAEESGLAEPQVQQQLQDLMGELVRETALLSTGECWMPAPVLKVAGPLSDKAAGAVMSLADSKGVSAVAFADRIEALDPGSPEASVVQVGAMALAGRAVPGCVPVEQINPVVPEGKREIRFEYHVPKGREPRHPGQSGAGRSDRLG